jgi:hypothetical protein
MAAIGGDPADPKKVVVVSLSGASHSEHDTDIPGAERDSVRAGHESDKFQVKSILAVPALLVAIVILAFGIVTALFVTQYHRFIPETSGFNPQSADLNTKLADDGKTRVDRDINDRLARFGSTAPKDVPGQPGTAVPQPRLEYLKQTAPDDPAFERSKRPVESPTNTYEIRPEDLRPNNYVDPVSKEKVLVSYGWVDPDRKVARIPIAEAMKQVLASKKLKARKDPLPRPDTSIHTPTLSNGGQATKPTTAAPTPEKDKH